MKYLNYYTTFLNESITAGSTIVYHRTGRSGHSPVKDIADNGFRVGDGASYGPGIYTTYDLESQLNENMRQYGPIIIECKVKTLEGFLIFDYDIAKKIYGNKNYRLDKQLNLILGNTLCNKLKTQQILDKIDELDSVEYSSDIANWLSRSPFISYVRGIIFTGRSDGKVLVSYDSTNVIPIRYSEDDGKIWNNLMSSNIFKRLKEESANIILQNIQNKIDLGHVLSDEEFEWCNDDLKKLYFQKIIEKGYELTDKEFEWCNDELKRFYIQKSIENGKLIDNKEFELCDDNMKKQYIRKQLFYKGDIYNLPKDFLNYISDEDKLKYIKKCIDSEYSISDEQFDMLNDELKKYWINNSMYVYTASGNNLGYLPPQILKWKEENM